MVISSVSAVVARPFLKWAGGKGQLLQQYLPYFPQRYQTYYEPFLGGGAVFFYLQPQGAVLTDINPELVNVYQIVRDQVELLIQALEVHRSRHTPDYYYQIRAQTQLSPLERAARFIYLNKTCFNGLYRENRRGQFNVPVGKYKQPRIYDLGLLRAASLALQSTELAVRPFEAVLDVAQNSQAFVYFDPPYHPLNPTSNFTAYCRFAFKEPEQIQLKQTFTELAQRGVQVMLSNSDCPFIRTLYQDFHIHPIQATRAINSKAERRGKIAEVLVTSYPVNREE